MTAPVTRPRLLLAVLVLAWLIPNGPGVWWWQTGEAVCEVVSGQDGWRCE